MWKAPVKDWIHDMYEKRQRKSEQKAKRSRKQSGKERINSKPQHLNHWFRCYFFALFQEEGEEN